VKLRKDMNEVYSELVKFSDEKEREVLEICRIVLAIEKQNFELRKLIKNITESWTNSNIMDSELMLSGYELFRCDRPNSHRGGDVLLYINGPFVHRGLFCPGDQLLPHRIITDKSCIKSFNDIVGKFVPNRTVQSESL